MRILIIFGAIAALCLAGCNGPAEGTLGRLGPRVRYAGVGTYPAGQMWSRMVVANAPKDPAASRPIDDEQVIVVIDGKTGELRECGNLSGYCVGLQPWAKSLDASRIAPINLARHADQAGSEPAATVK